MGISTIFQSRRHRAVIVLVLWVAGSVGVARAMAEVEPLPSSSELHQLFTDGQYAPLLAKLAKVQPLNGTAGAPYDKVDLAILKTNTLIAMKQQQAAVRSIDEAVRLTTESTTPTQAAEALALQVLLKYSPKLTYTPKPAGGEKPGEGISIDVATRDGAYHALLANLQADAAEKTRAAKDAKSLAPIGLAIAKLNETAPVERFVSKSDAACQKSIDELSDLATTRMNDALKPLVDRTKKITDLSSTIITTRTTQADGSVSIDKRKRGLMNAEPGELRDIAGTCEQIQAACRDLAQLSKRHTKDFEKVFATANGASTDARKLLKTYRP